MLQFYQEEDYENTLRTSPFNSEPRIRHIPHNKVDTYEQNSDGLFRFVCFFQQELTAKLIHLENPVKFINISKEGYLGLWTTNLTLEKVYSAADEFDDSATSNINANGQNRRRAGMWVTDAVYMTDAHKLVLATTSRDLRFFTISSETFLEEFCIFGQRKFHCVFFSEQKKLKDFYFQA